MARASLFLASWRAGDEDAFTPRPDAAAERAATGWDWSRGPPGPTWTLMRYPREVLGVGGGVMMAGGCMQAWSCLAELPRGDWAMAIDCAALVRADFAGAARVIRRLGFADVGAGPPGYRMFARGPVG